MCPCFLTEDFGETGPAAEREDAWISLLEKQGGKVAHTTIHPDMYREGRRYVCSVPKKELDVAVVFGNRHYDVLDSGDRLVLGSGFEADSIFAHCAGVDCRKETASDTVHLYKQWCTLQLRLEGSEAWKPYFFEIHGNWNGFSLRNLRPTEGALFCVPRKTSPNSFEVRLPRQGDASLSLQVYDTDAYGLPAELKYEYPLGRLMENRGYDWKRQNLADAVITIDYARADVYVTVSEWDDGGTTNNITI